MVAPSTYRAPEQKPPTLWSVATDSLSTLQFKATALVVVLTLSVTAAVSGYLLQTSGQLAREKNEAQLVHAASLLARAAATEITGNRPEALCALATESADAEPLLYVVISDPSGRELAAAEHKSYRVLTRLPQGVESPSASPGTPVAHSIAGIAPVLLDVSFPITLRDSPDNSGPGRPTDLLGYVRTGTVANEWQRTMSGKLDLAVGVGILALVVAVPLGFLVIRRIVAPLEGLGDAMLNFSQGRLDVRCPRGRSDEIGRLATAFNQMADQHQQTHERIVRLNAELEERVAHRTQQLRELASREPLTGLYNRRYFGETLARRFAEASRYGEDISCVMIDLDEFKAANDNFGHHVGDELLLLTARTLLSQLRSADVASRYGGDEFILLLPQTDADQARILSQRVAERFAKDLRELFPDVKVSMSVGIASLRATGAEDADALVRAADQALYVAKASGKNKLWTAGDPAPVATK
ncbi:MAG: diguanylate cyclase [Planctomycetota bacterium]